jgi:uncharacterized RDD family membrane protein YckC
MIENPASTPNPYATPQADLRINSAPDGAVLELASLGERLAAALIDTLIMFVVVFIPIVMFYGGWEAFVAADTEESYASTVATTGFSYFMYIVVHGYLLAKSGQSIGKKIVDIKIVRTDGNRASFGRLVGIRALFENALFLVPVVDMWLSTIDVLCIFKSSRKCLHDTVADTIVVRV